MAACDGSDRRNAAADIVENRPRSEIGEPEFGLATTVEDVTEDINRFVGRRLTLQGEVVRVLGPQVFALGGESVRHNQDVIVVSPSPVAELESDTAGLPRLPHPIVRVRGTLRRLSPAEIKKHFGGEVRSDLSSVTERRPLLIAEAVQVVPVPGPGRVR